MSIPTYEQIMLPMLKILADGKTHTLLEVTEKISEMLQLSVEEKKRLLPSGTQTYIYNRTGWARTHLKKAGLIQYESRGIFKISPEGKKVLMENPKEITNKFLSKYDSFKEFTNVRSDKKIIENEASTPEEIIENHFELLRENLSNELLETISNNSPIFFEKLVINVLLKLGYGGTEKEARTTLRSNDEGIDGIIKEDKLGLDIIYIQAKRWKKESSIGRPEIQKFAGALQGQRARKGVFITTGLFSNTAIDFVKQIDSKIILIDGKKLTALMIENNIGISVKNTYSVKEIDTDFFIED